MYAELLLPVLLLLGLATRLSALGLMVVTAVAWAAVHAGSGYNVCDNGYKMALIYIVVLIPLLFQGAGGWSLDTLLKKRFYPQYRLKQD
ncbi:membrane protein [Neisseria meningitidis]|nr:membrane protein [Neisseria meningitidis]